MGAEIAMNVAPEISQSVASKANVGRVGPAFANAAHRKVSELGDALKNAFRVSATVRRLPLIEVLQKTPRSPRRSAAAGGAFGCWGRNITT